MAIKKVWLDESENDCISCGVCEITCPEVFEVPDRMIVKQVANFDAYEAAIRDAVESCPSEVIKFE
ncbi:MAG: ferredoxin [Bacteroidetes bacterium]|nr:ferredoxin [Bacteroidota bacterium]